MLVQSFNHKSFAFAVVAALAAVSLQPREAQAAGPFAKFAGDWAGSGTISMSNGTHERIRCRVTYAVEEAGTGLTQDLVCASDSYKFDVKSDVRSDGGALSGSWTETSRNVTGQVTGTIGKGIIRATVRGATFSAGLSLAVSGNLQSVLIEPQGTTDVVQVKVRLKRT